MKEADEVLLSAGESIEYARQYIQQEKDLFRLEAAERIAKTTSIMITTVLLALLVGMIALMLSIAAGLWLGDLWNSYPKAFLTVAGAYLIFGFFVYLFRRSWVTNPVLNLTLSAFFYEEEESNKS